MILLNEEAMIEIIRKAVSPLLAEYLGKQNNQPDENPLTIEQAADFLHVTKATIHNWRKQGRIKCERIGGRVYFQKDQLVNALKHNNYRKN